MTEVIIPRAARTMGTLIAALSCMNPDPKKHPTAPETTPPREGDFAEEAAPKKTEFDTEKNSKDLTSGGFDKIP